MSTDNTCFFDNIADRIDAIKHLARSISHIQVLSMHLKV